MFLNNLLYKISSLAGLRGKFISGKARSLAVLRILIFAVAVIMAVQPFGYQVQVKGQPAGCSCSDSDNCHEFTIGDENFPTGWPNLVNKTNTSETFSNPDEPLEVKITGVYWKDCLDCCPDDCTDGDFDDSDEIDSCDDCELTVFNWDSDWNSSASGISVDEVYVWGGADGSTYTYDTSTSSEVTSDDNLSVGGYQSDDEKYNGSAIGHITFCYDTDSTPSPSLSLSIGNLEIVQSGAGAGQVALENLSSSCVPFSDNLDVTIENCDSWSDLEAWYEMGTTNNFNHPVLKIDKDNDGVFEDLEHGDSTKTSLTMSGSSGSFPIKVCLDELGDMSAEDYEFDIYVEYTCDD